MDLEWTEMKNRRKDFEMKELWLQIVYFFNFVPFFIFYSVIY